MARIKTHLAALQELPEDIQDTESIRRLETKLAGFAGKQPTPLGEQREAAMLTHLLGKLRTTYALDKEACLKEAKAAKAALEAAQARVTKAEECEASIDLDFQRREARVKAVLANCTADAPIVHLPSAPTAHTLPVDILSTKLAAEAQKIRAELGLGVETPELRAVEAFCSRLLSSEMQSNIATDMANHFVAPSATADYASGSTSPMDLLDLNHAPHTSMVGDLGDAWMSPVPQCDSEESTGADW